MKVRIISASAGSGKTTRLSEVLDEAMSSGAARPEGIIATTFTRLAAAELVERARGQLLAAGKSIEAEKLLSARIGTVNAVCGTLVSDFAFELGLSPALRVLDDTSAELELRRALAQVVSHERAYDLQRVKYRFDQSFDWHFEVRRIIEAARANAVTVQVLRQCSERSIRQLDDCLGPVDEISDFDARLGRALQLALKGIDTGTDKTDGTRKYVELVRSCARNLDRGRLRWGGWTKLVGAGPCKKSRAHAEAVREAAAGHIAHPGLRREMHQLIRQLFEVAADGLEAYQEHKRARGLIDFVDQEVLALELLRDPEVRAELEPDLDLILVDEFQDTSPIQLAIFLELASLANESVWVGDPKQAIYAFRGTDPALMDAAIESLVSPLTDPELVTSATSALGGDVETLSISYRSRPDLVALTNDVFAPAFAARGLPEARTRLTPKLVDEPPGLGPVIEHWPLELSRGNAGADARAAATASGIQSLLARPVHVRDRDSGEARVARAADVAVLCRTNAQCQSIADALAALGIPAVVPRMGLLDTAEGQLVWAGLRLWLDPGDALAAAELSRLVTHPTDLGPLAGAVLRTPGTGAWSTDPAVQALLSARRAQPDLGPVAALLVVLDATQARELCAAWGQSGQRLANLDAWIAHATSFASEARGAGDAPTLASFLAHLDAMADDGSWNSSRSDSQALLGGEDAITVATWHRSKGLEWPLTILFGLESPREPAAHGVHVMSEAAELDIADPLAGRWIRFWPNPYTTSNQKGPIKDAYEASPSFDRLRTKAEHEALRVLYVGWTRARDRLILAAQRGKLMRGLVGVLGRIDARLITEPASESAGLQTVTWAGRTVDVLGAPASPAVPVPTEPRPGLITVGREPTEYPPARQSPSSVEPVPCTIGEPIDLGARLVIAGKPDMAHLGDAVHGFLAADRPGLSDDQRHQVAARLLQRFDVADHLAPDAVIAAANRLWAWLADTYPGATLYREWPLAALQSTGTLLSGTADLLVEHDGRFILIDHKTFPGSRAQALERVPRYSGQLAAYQAALRATGRDVFLAAIHLPVSGLVVPVS